MNTFSENSKQRLETCHRDLRTLFGNVIQDFDCTIVCGHRDKPEQDKAFAEGKSKLQYPNSKHNSNPSMAVLSIPYDWRLALERVVDCQDVPFQYFQVV